MAFSMDFRRAVAAAYDAGESSAELAGQFRCSESWVRRLIQHRRERGTLEPLSTARHTDSRAYDDADELKIRELIAARPDATLAEVVEAVGKPVHPATAGRTLARLGLPRKKSRRTPASGTGPTSRARRACRPTCTSGRCRRARSCWRWHGAGCWNAWACPSNAPIRRWTRRRAQQSRLRRPRRAWPKPRRAPWQSATPMRW